MPHWRPDPHCQFEAQQDPCGAGTPTLKLSPSILEAIERGLGRPSLPGTRQTKTVLVTSGPQRCGVAALGLQGNVPTRTRPCVPRVGPQTQKCADIPHRGTPTGTLTCPFMLKCKHLHRVCVLHMAEHTSIPGTPAHSPMSAYPHTTSPHKQE